MVVFGHDHIGHGESDGSRAYIENVDHYVDDVITHCMKMQAIFKITSLPMKDNASKHTGQASGPSPVPDRPQHGRHDRPQSRPQAPGLLHRDDSQRAPDRPRAAGESGRREQQPSDLLPGRSHRLQIHSIPDICLQGSVAASELGHSSRAHWPAKHECHNQVGIKIGCE